MKFQSENSQKPEENHSFGRFRSSPNSGQGALCRVVGHSAGEPGHVADAMEAALLLMHALALIGLGALIRALRTWLGEFVAWMHCWASWFGCGCGRRSPAPSAQGHRSAARDFAPLDGQRAPVRSMDGTTPNAQAHDADLHARLLGAPQTARGSPLARARWIWAGHTVIRWIRIRRRWAHQGQSLQTIPFRGLWEHLDCRKYGRPTWADAPKPQPRPKPQQPLARAAPCLRSRVRRMPDGPPPTR